jgi:uncharacterized protein (DUF697 family)
MREQEGWMTSGLKKALDRILDLGPLRHLSDDKRAELREDIDVIRDVIARQRPPRIAIAGREDVPLEPLIEMLLGGDIEGDADIKAQLGRGRWYRYETTHGGGVELLDARCEDAGRAPLKAVRRQRPDVVLLPWTYEETPDDGSKPVDVTAVDRLLDEARRGMTPGEASPSVIVMLEPTRLPAGVKLGRAERVVRQQLLGSGIPGNDITVVETTHHNECTRQIQQRLPPAARLQFARVSPTSESRRRIAQTLIRASAGMTATIATIPLPMADIVPITTAQILMIASIAHLGGRKFSLKTVAEFLVAAGINVGAGYAARELVRALAQFVPLAGAAVSSGIAAGATFALGNAAIEYFLDDSAQPADINVWNRVSE